MPERKDYFVIASSLMSEKEVQVNFNNIIKSSRYNKPKKESGFMGEPLVIINKASNVLLVYGWFISE